MVVVGVRDRMGVHVTDASGGNAGVWAGAEVAAHAPSKGKDADAADVREVFIACRVQRVIGLGMRRSMVGMAVLWCGG